MRFLVLIFHLYASLTNRRDFDTLSGSFGPSLLTPQSVGANLISHAEVGKGFTQEGGGKEG